MTTPGIRRVSVTCVASLILPVAAAAKKLVTAPGPGTPPSAANAMTFLNSNNPGAAGKIFSEGSGVPGYQSGAACITP